LSDKSAKTRVSVVLTKPYVEGLDHFVDEGLYLERQTVIRAALRGFFRLHGIEAFAYKGAKLETEVDLQEP